MSGFSWVLFGVALVVLKFALDKVLSLRAAFSSVENYPGGRVQWINPIHAIALLLGNRFPRLGSVGHYEGKMTLYKEFGSTIFVSINFATAQQYFWVADADALKIVSGDRHTFQKPTAGYEVVNFHGENIITVGESDWKRHRSIAMSAFNEANVSAVWVETLRIVNEWFQALDFASNGLDIDLDMCQTMTQVTLLVIAAAGFGKKLSWTGESSTELPPGCQLPFRSAVINSNIVFRALFPEWFYRLSTVLKVPFLSSRALLTRLAFQDLHTHMLDLVASARADIASEKHPGVSGAALLRNIVEANMNQDGDSKKLSDGEVLSNIFVFLLAGHETSSHTLAFAFALMALYPECQQKVFEEVMSIWPEDMSDAHLTSNTKEYVDKLEYTTAFFRETLRLYPVASRIVKDVARDTTLHGTYFVPGSTQSPTLKGKKFALPIPAGSVVCMDIWALHMNPLYWGEDVEAFKPERFIDTESYQWPRNAYMPFSAGGRSCIGQRFAITESMCILANVVRNYRVLVPDDIASLSHEAQRKWLLEWKVGLTLTPVNARVKLSRRV